MLCFKVFGASEAEIRHPTAVPDWGGVDVAIPKAKRISSTWE